MINNYDITYVPGIDPETFNTGTIIKLTSGNKSFAVGFIANGPLWKLIDKKDSK